MCGQRRENKDMANGDHGNPLLSLTVGQSFGPQRETSREARNGKSFVCEFSRKWTHDSVRMDWRLQYVRVEGIKKETELGMSMAPQGRINEYLRSS